MPYSKEDANRISKLISNSNDFEEILNLEKVFEDEYENKLLLQMGYLKNGDYVLYESFVNTEILTYEEFYFNWGVIITVKNKTITDYNDKEYDFSKSFDEIIEDFKKDTQKSYKTMEKNEFLSSMEQQLKIQKKNMVFQSYNFEMMMQSSNINFIKESFSL